MMNSYLGLVHLVPLFGELPLIHLTFLLQLPSLRRFLGLG